ncbi:choline transporter [Corynebacterium sp. HMSC30G07]|uniref:BCCT family transporter n=1 Tax=Corynebacterium sp. HMSC30G07 TaxID=1581072 RepID=UPI0008A38AAA|nr:BCCT family transporter [Corynebacterium sp. HMSC30G07]OFT76543.1 choline transporter [Corynebacterium sp. HMSC30G07]
MLGGHRGTAVGLYPHNLHPGLVPGISVEQNYRSFRLDRVIFFVTGILIVSFIIWGITNPEGVSSASTTAFGWAMENAVWLLNAVMVSGVFLMLYLAFSRYGSVPLGRDGDKPEFSRFSWVAMMFAAGIGVGVFFFGPSEPLAYFISPPPHTVEPETPEALHLAMAQSHYHWAFLIWGLYAMVGGAIAYSTYRRGRRTLISSVFRPLLGPEPGETVLGRIIDMLAIAATLFGTAATLGLSAIQITRGVEIVAGLGPAGNNLIVIVIAILGVCVVLSAVSGVARGIRYLSNINITLTLGVIAFVFFTGPTLFLLNLIPSGGIAFFDNFLSMASKSLSWGPETIEFQGWWTAFYWAWWIAWTPFVGMFIARISRGRTLREFILVTTIVPASLLILAFTVFGGTAIQFHRDGVAGFDGTASNEQVLFAMIEQLPLNSIMPVLLILILAVFFITAADSASVVMGTLSTKGDPAPNKLVVAFWGLCMMGIAIVMLLAGGKTTLTALQNLTILVAIPFAVVLIGIAVSFVLDLRTDPAVIRKDYAVRAIEQAVQEGLKEHGDDFQIAVSVAPSGKGAGTGFDSTSSKVTDWYKRTDSEGSEIDFDVETRTWADEER